MNRRGHVERVTSETQVDVNLSLDGEGNATMIITQPYHIVKIPKTTLPAILQ